MLTAIFLGVHLLHAGAQSPRMPSFTYTHFSGCSLVLVSGSNEGHTEELIVDVPMTAADIQKSPVLTLDLSSLPDGVRIWINVFDGRGPHNSPLSDVILRRDETPASWNAKTGRAIVTTRPTESGLYLATVELQDAVFVRSDGVEVRAQTPIRIEAETGKCGG